MVEFDANEKLLRAVRNKPNFWKKNGKLSPMAFKTRTGETGTSVFRQASRSLQQSVEDVAQKLEGAIVSVTCGFCKDLIINIEETNVATHHCELTNANLKDNCTSLTNKQCQDLADFAVIEKK